MKTQSLNSIYHNISKQISLVESYTEIKDLSYIIKSCRLKPYDYLFKKKSPNLILYKWWVDEYGNSFKLNGKRVELTFNDLKVNKNNLVNTDLYSGLSIDNVLKISKLAYINTGVDEELYQKYYHINLLGIDNYLRSYLYMYDNLESIAPLTLGIKNLKLLAHHKDIKYFLTFKKKENNPIPCLQPEQWISSLPAHQDFIQEMNKHHPVIYNIFKENI
mgnify:CR=1 FL=1